MKKLKFILFLIPLLIVFACNETENISSFNPENWGKRIVKNLDTNKLRTGKSYLSVYSQIYQRHERIIINLTATISIRNISPKDTIYVLKADYFNTHGEQIRQYFKQTIFLAPLETVEIVIDETDSKGGTGANFVFDWAVNKNGIPPLFEAVMTSSTQKGLAFTSTGILIDN